MSKDNKNRIKKFVIGGTYGAVDEAISMVPGANIVWAFVKGGKEAISSVAYARTEELLKFFEDNASTLFNKELLQDEHFVTGLGITYEKFVRQRLQEKRKLYKQIFLNFAEQSNKEEFELERMYSVLESISIGAVRFISLLQEQAMPQQKEVLERSPYNRNDEYWAGMPRMQKEHPISKFLKNYKDMNVSLGKNDLPEEVQQVLKFEDDYVAELVGLSILRYIPQEKIETATRVGKTEFKFRMDYSFTVFGLEFIKYIEV